MIGTLSFYKNKKVFITGNTGFKGSWLTFILLSAGAEVIGYSLQPSTYPNLFSIISLDQDHRLKQYYADVRDLNTLLSAFDQTKPDFVFHLAAQPIVRDSYKDPVKTYTTNVMGTVNVCEAIRLRTNTESTLSFLNVTTDKVYRNNEWIWGYREADYLDGFDPYSNSKSCSELITRSYNDSFFKDLNVRVSTARAGNVIGGGDFSSNRIIPDCVRAVEKNEIINVRNPYSIRPYQHVLEPLFVYLMIAKAQYESNQYSGSYNVGPDDVDCITTGNLVDIFCKKWNENISWQSKIENNAPHEATYLKLDCSKLKHVFNWQPRWHIDKAIERTVDWLKVWRTEKNVKFEMHKEINEYAEN